MHTKENWSLFCLTVYKVKDACSASGIYTPAAKETPGYATARAVSLKANSITLSSFRPARELVADMLASRIAQWNMV